MSSFVPGIRRFVLGAPSRLFVCSQCIRQAQRAQPSTIVNILQSRSYTAAKPSASLLHLRSSVTPSSGAPAADGASFASPKTTPKGVAFWLVGSALSVFGITIFGGLTRLTESG